MSNPNILSGRYVTPQINQIFSETGRIIFDRELWIAVMKAQRELGINIPAGDIEKFEAAKTNVDLEFIRIRESETKHDVKAKIEAFVRAAGAGQYLHLGMTSRDLTDNVEQMQYRNAAKVIIGRNVSILRHMLDNSDKYKEDVIVARTHNQPAQATLLGRRFSMWAEEMILGLRSIDSFVKDYPLRGIKGPVGTQFDMLVLFEGDQEKVNRLEELVASHLGFDKTLKSTGQIYPRSLDSAMLNRLAELTAGPANFAKTMRLMAGFGLVNEGFDEGQSGSSAMPYKMNTRSCERINGFAELAKMYADGASRISGDQWGEGDVSDSVVRRVIMTDSFYAADGIAETTLTVLNRMEAYRGEIIQELSKYLPFMATTELLQRAVMAGAGREDAHRAIKKISVEESKRMKREGDSRNNLPELLAASPLFSEKGIVREDINSILESSKRKFVGNASPQIEQVREESQYFLEAYKDAAAYEPGAIL